MRLFKIMRLIVICAY